MNLFLNKFANKMSVLIKLNKILLFAQDNNGGAKWLIANNGALVKPFLSQQLMLLLTQTERMVEVYTLKKAKDSLPLNTQEAIIN